MNVSEEMFVGIDVSKDGLDVALDDQGKTRHFANDEAGIAQLLGMLGVAEVKVGAVVLEATGGFERLAATALCSAGHPVMVVNPRQARDFAKAMGFLAKTDSIDAMVLSHFARTLHQSDKRERLLMRLPDAHQVLLQALLTRRNQLIQMRVAEDNRLSLSHKSQRKSIEAVRRVLNKQIADIDQDMDTQLKGHFAEKLALLKGFKGIGPGMQEIGRASCRERV